MYGVSMGHTHITQLTFGGIRRDTHDFSTHVGLVALTHVLVDHSLTTHLARVLRLTYLRSAPCLDVIHLASGHWLEHEVLVVPLEGICIGTTVVNGSFVKLPWAS